MKADAEVFMTLEGMITSDSRESGVEYVEVRKEITRSLYGDVQNGYKVSYMRTVPDTSAPPGTGLVLLWMIALPFLLIAAFLIQEGGHIVIPTVAIGVWIIYRRRKGLSIIPGTKKRTP